MTGFILGAVLLLVIATLLVVAMVAGYRRGKTEETAKQVRENHMRQLQTIDEVDRIARTAANPPSDRVVADRLRKGTF